MNQIVIYNVLSIISLMSYYIVTGNISYFLVSYCDSTGFVLFSTSYYILSTNGFSLKLKYISFSLVLSVV